MRTRRPESTAILMSQRWHQTSAGTTTVPIFMVKCVTSEGLSWARLSAAGTMAILPIVIIGWTAQRQLVRNLSLGAVK